MFIPNNLMGSKIRLSRPVKTLKGTFTEGHIFKVKDVKIWGLYVEDIDGNTATLNLKSSTDFEIID